MDNPLSSLVELSAASSETQQQYSNLFKSVTKNRPNIKILTVTQRKVQCKPVESELMVTCTNAKYDAVCIKNRTIYK